MTLDGVSQLEVLILSHCLRGWSITCVVSLTLTIGDYGGCDFLYKRSIVIVKAGTAMSHRWCCLPLRSLP